MNIETQIAAAVRQPRKRPTPSARDQQIYLDYQTSAKLQSELAKQYDLTQCRISQIIRRVEKWLCAAPDELSETSDPLARQRLRSRLQFELLTTAARHALRHFQEQQKTVTHKKGTRGGKEIDETTERLLPPSIQCLKVVLQANNQLSRLEKQPAPDAEQQPTEQQLADDSGGNDPKREDVEAWLTEQRDQAQRAGLVNINHGNNILVHDLVSAFLGQPNYAVARNALAEDAHKRVVTPKSYGDKPPVIPPQYEGSIYPMHDRDGNLVAWITADQLEGAISADYPPVKGD